MSFQERLFSIDRDPESLIAHVARTFKVAVNPIPESRRLYLDSFDWGLYSKGLALSWESAQAGSLLTLARLGGETVASMGRARPPAFCSALEPSPFRKRIENAVGVRRLLPRLTLDFSGWEVRILDEREKVTALLLLPEGKVRATFRKKKTRALPRWVRVVPVRGFGSVHRELTDLVGHLAGTTLQEPFYEAALRAAGETPGDYSSKLDVRLEPAMPSVAALKLLFLKLLGTMQINEVGLCADLDPEFLHDFRVAVRRTRALLGRSKQHLDPKVLEEFNREFRWLGQLTGKKRDLDVFLIKLEQLKARRVVKEVEDLGPLIELLRQRQYQEGKALSTVIRGSRYQDLVSNWSNALEREDSFRAERARESVYALASPRIWKIYRKILRKGAGLSESTEPLLLHELRIDCKKLRYLLEFFRSLYPQPLMSGLISDLKGLQDILGDFNDCHVQYQNLKTYVDEAWAEKQIPARTFLVAGRLLEQMEASQQALRRHFSDRFNLFANRSRKKALKKELSRRRIRVD